MEEIAVSKFKATCLAVLERVRRTRTPVRITRFGDPLADVVPPCVPPRSDRWLGGMKATGQIRGDLVVPVIGEEEWEVLRP